MKIPFRNSLLLIALSVAPAICAAAIYLIVRVNAYHSFQNLSMSAAIVEVLDEPGEVAHTSGAAGIILLLANYLSCFGILSVVTVVALRWVNPKRVMCFYIVATGVILLALFGHLDRTDQFRPQAMSITWGISAQSDFSGLFLEYGLIYRWYWLPLALAIGAVATRAPIFGPSIRESMEQGRCPVCRYQLQGKFDAGCPECGWRRSDHIASRWQISWLRYRSMVNLRSMTFAVLWTVTVVVLAGVFRPYVIPNLPRHIDVQPFMHFERPRSGAYSDVLINPTLQYRTGWFGQPGQTVDMQWHAVFREMTRVPTLVQRMAGDRGDYDVLAQLFVDESRGMWRLVVGESEETFMRQVTARSVAQAMNRIFPDASFDFLEEEAEAIFFALDARRNEKWEIVLERGQPGYLAAAARFVHLQSEDVRELPVDERPFWTVVGGMRGLTGSMAPSASIIGLTCVALVWICGIFVILRACTQRFRPGIPVAGRVARVKVTH